MTTVRFIDRSELNHVRTLFSEDDRLIGEPVAQEYLEDMISTWDMLMEKNEMMITMIFDENNEPIVMYTARLYPNLKSWWVGATKIKAPNNHYNTSARMMVPALELLLDTLESMGYYKFWMGAPEQHHDIRNVVMKKYSERLNRYEWYDEYIIPQGERCDVYVWEHNRRTCTWSDILIRMFVLKQEFRKPLVTAAREKLRNV
jgi:hypothetical protein